MNCEYKIIYDGIHHPSDVNQNGTPSGVKASVHCKLRGECPIAGIIKNEPEHRAPRTGIKTQDKLRSELMIDFQSFLRGNCPNYR